MKELLLILILSFTSCKLSGQQIDWKYPDIVKDKTVESYHGIKVSDDYRNIENLSDTVVRSWFENQENLTNSLLDTLGEVKKFKNLITDLKKRTTSFAESLKYDESGNKYYLKKINGSDVYDLYYKEKGAREEIKIFSPDNYGSKPGQEYVINYIQPSWNGKYIAVSLNENNDFSSELIVIEISTQKRLDDKVTNLAPDLFYGINWLPDNTGFTYLFFPVIEKGLDGYKKNSLTKLHFINDSQKEDLIVFGQNDDKRFDPNFFPLTRITSSHDNYIFGYVATTDNFYDAYYTSIASIKVGKPTWKKLYSTLDKVLFNYGTLVKDKYYYMTSTGAPNFKVCSIDMNNIDFSDPSIIVPEKKNEVITDFKATDGALYYTTAMNGVEAKLNISKENSDTEIELPVKVGRISMIQPSVYDNQLIIQTVGWTVDLVRLLVDTTGVKSEIVLAELPEFPEFSNILVQEIEVAGHDGAMIPVSIISNKDTEASGGRPVLITSYGAFGESEIPYFSPTRLSWVAAGGTIAVAHIRGGGEKGEAWHLGGQKGTKSNSWKDIISTTEYLIEKGYTTSSQTILYTSSAGAISSAMAMISRPDLFQVFIGRVPLLNPIRSFAGSYKTSSYIEFGDIEDKNEFRHLLAMDPYLNLKPDVSYPSTMLIPSENDDRLDLWESGKFIARLQEYNTSSNPIILDVSLNSGHSKSSTEATARAFGFAMWCTN